MRRKQSAILPEGNVLVKDFVIWLNIDYKCGLTGIYHNYHTLRQALQSGSTVCHDTHQDTKRQMSMYLPIA